MSTSVTQIHNLLESESKKSKASNLNVQGGFKEDDIVLAIQLIVAFTASHYLNVDSFLPENIISTFGHNSFIISTIFLLVCFFALRYWTKSQEKKNIKE